MNVQCRTQAECDAALAAGNVPELIGDGWFEIRGSSYVVARESSDVVARGSSHVEARGSSHVEAWESSHVEAWGSSHVEAWGSSHVVASKQVAVHKHEKSVTVKGGVVIVVKTLTNPKEWCEFYGVKIEKGTAILFKAVRDDYRSAHEFLYQPGTTPAAPDWDGGKAECGGGLHFSPSPVHAMEFDSDAVRFVACPVKLSEIVVHKNASYPKKVKAPRVFKPIYEVNRYGEKI